MTQRIPLSGRRGQGLFALVDDADAELASRYTWHLYVSTAGRHYARTNIREPGRATPRKIMMSQLLTGKRYLDHRNGNGLDNRRRNFREADFSQNGANGGKRRTRGAPTSRFKGVSLHRGSWTAQLRYQGSTRYLGRFTDEAMAAQAYDQEAVRLWGEYARTNVDLGLLPPLAAG